eukprot:3891749-Pyramimonas_sp.AAC.1
MRTGRQPGEYCFVAEALKYGGPAIRAEVYGTAKRMWSLAATAAEGEEAEAWPADWRVGLVVPLWKRKGSLKDKNTWRGITLLSVGSKLLARVVASRVSE